MGQKSEIMPQDLFGGLTISRNLLHIHYLSGSKPEGFTGSAWRGILGSGLQQILCPYTKKSKCLDSCSLQQAACPFFSLFRKESTLPGKTAAPKGYILHSAPTKKDNGETLEVSLFGNCHQFLLPIIEILHRAGRNGLTHQQCQFEIIEQEPLQPTSGKISEPFRLKEWIEPENKTADKRFIFQIPVRLRKNKKILGKMDWPFFFITLVRRLEALNCIYNDGTPLEREPMNMLENTFQSWDNIKDTLKWHDLWRYSSPQGKKIPLGGLTGDVSVNQCTPVQRAWFQAASLVGVGKAAVMGLGKIAEKNSGSNKQFL